MINQLDFKFSSLNFAMLSPDTGTFTDEMIEEFATTLPGRIHYQPVLTFHEWLLKREDYNPAMMPVPNDFGRAFLGHAWNTARTVGLQKSSWSRIQYESRMKEAYAEDVRSGKVSTIKRTLPLNLELECDRAYVKICLRRRIQKEHRTQRA